MKNEDVVKFYFNNDKKGCKHSLNVYANFENLVNYNTIMVHYEKETNIYYVNVGYYSHTTSKIQSYINRYISMNANIIYYYGDKYGDNYMIEKAQIKFIGYYSSDDPICFLKVASIYRVNVNKLYIQFYHTYYNSIGSLIERVIKTDKNNREFFQYNKKRYYLNELIIKDKKQLYEIVERG